MRMLGSIFLIAGTSIGAGMLALPVLTAEAGFFPSAVLFITVWAFTLFTALLIVEVNLSFTGDVDLISMTKKILGKKASSLCVLLFLLLLYSLTGAYLAGSGSIISEMVERRFGFIIPEGLAPIIPLIIIGLFVFMGTHAVDRANRVFIGCLVGTYVGLVIAGMPSVMSSSFTLQNYKLLFGAVPVVVTSFAFHIIIPTVVSYLSYNVRLIKKTIIIGSLIPLIVYLLWQYIILGVVPIEDIRRALIEGAPITEAFGNITGSPWIISFGMGFSFFAIITSLLGVSLALFSFLKDGFQNKSKGKGLMIMTFLPPLLFVEIFPRGFIMALQYAGVLVALLSGILPALLVYRARIRGFNSSYRAPGGAAALIGAVLISLLIIISDIISQ